MHLSMCLTKLPKYYLLLSKNENVGCVSAFINMVSWNCVSIENTLQFSFIRKIKSLCKAFVGISITNDSEWPRKSWRQITYAKFVFQTSLTHNFIHEPFVSNHLFRSFLRLNINYHLKTSSIKFIFCSSLVL